MTRILQTDLARDALYTKVNQIADEKVSLTGNETITGAKTFTNSVVITNNIIPTGDITLGTSTNTWGKQLQFRDTTGKRIARIQPMAIDTTNNRVGMWVNNADNTVEKGIYVDSDGTTYAPTPATVQDSSNKIATTGWVNTVGNNVVHKTGDETIAGYKTFTSNVVRANTNITKGTNPSSKTYCTVELTDKNGGGTKNRVGIFESAINTNGDIETFIGAYKYDNNSTTIEKISVIYPKTGNPYTFAPASDVDGSILTTVKKSKGKNGYFKLGNGLIIQWGSVTASSVALTITLPTAFSSATSYSISAITNNGKAAFTQQQTSTTFHLDASGGIGNTSLKWIAIGY